MKPKVIVTGASGVLGSAVYNAFKAANNPVLGLAHTRATSELLKLDLLDSPAVEATFADFQPNIVIHCAAERKPDVAEKNPEGTKKLNIDVTAHLARLAQGMKFRLIYISTDYVFDGYSPPYATTATPAPVNLYGKTKRAGELPVLEAATAGTGSAVLRVPVLYGPAEKNSDTAVNILLDVVQDQSGKAYKMDHRATRFPTNVLDISQFLVRLSLLPPSYPPILHFSAPEPYTKYEMCLVFAKLLNLPHGHIEPEAELPKGVDATSRPLNTQLDVTTTEASVGPLDTVVFEEWWAEYLGKESKSSSDD